MARKTTPDRQAERGLLERARRGEIEALQALVHRFSSLVWSACTLSTPDHPTAVAVFHECWDLTLGSLDVAQLEPDLAGMVIGRCRRRLSKDLDARSVDRAIASAAQLSGSGEVVVHVPPGAMGPLNDIVRRHADRLSAEAETRRAHRHRGALLPFVLVVAIAAALAVIALGLGGESAADAVARGVRLRVVQGDLVPLYRDCVSPPFSVAERDPAETRGLEQIALVLEELANTPPEVTGEQLGHLRRRVRSQDLVDFASERAERSAESDRHVLLTVQLILEEIANL